MVGQSTGQPFTEGARTNRQFVEQLAAWGFIQRKVDGVHLVFRGPHGGTLRVIRSLLGRAEAVRVEKAAALAGVTVDRFWAGPDDPVPQPRRAVRPVASAAGPARSRRSADRDRVTALVLGVHAQADRPLGFDQVVDLAGGRVTREQVRTASAQLCREKDLDRIRSGVYQWSGGTRSRTQPTTPATPPAPQQPAHQQPTPQQPAPPALPARQQALPTPTASTHPAAAELFDQLFPDGVRMTADLLADFERWAELTEKLAQHAHTS